jgi:hypothetical protein
MANTTYNPNPYDWKSLLANYATPASINTQYNITPAPYTPSYGYELQQLMAQQGSAPALRYDVANPTSALSTYANRVLQDYNTRNPTKTASAFNETALNDYIKNYNTANNINLSSFKQTVTPEQQAQILAQYGGGKTALTDKMYNSYIADYNKGNDLTAAQEQQKIVDEYNASRTANQSAYDASLADYNTRAAAVKANPQEYYKPVQMYETPVVQNAYYNKFAPKQAQQEQTVTAAACGGLMRKYADGGAVQPQKPMVQDMMQRYNIQRQPIRPLGQAPMSQPPMGQPPMGQIPMGQPPMGQMPMGQMPMGQPPAMQPKQFYNGGAVRGYADGDLVTDDNGQAFADAFAAGQQQFPTRQDEPINQMAQRYDIDPAQAKSYEEQRALLAQLQTALGKQQPKNTGASDAEAYFRIAAALGRPTRFGSFGESLGPVAESLADTMASRKEAERLGAAQQIANIQARMGLIKEQRELGKEENLQKMVYKYMNKGKNVIDDVSGKSASDSDGLPDDMRALILTQPPEKAIATLIDFAKENNKPSDLIRGVKYLVANNAISPEKGNEIIQDNLQGKVEQIDVSVPELGGTFKLTGPEARKYYESSILPTRLAPKGAQASPTPGAAQQQAPLSQEQMEAKKVALTEQAKADIEEGKTLVASKPFAQKQVQLAKTISGMAKTNPKSFGIIADPGLSNAVATIIDKGVSTPWGAISVDVEEPLAKLKLSKTDLQARRQVLQPLIEMEIGFRKLYLKGEGPVSNVEGELAKFIGPQLSDDPVTVQRKAGMIEIGAAKQARVIDAYQAYKSKHPEAGPQSFYQTPEFKNIEAAYDKKYMDFVQKNNIPFEYKGPASTGGSIVERLRQERANRQGR